MAASPPANVRIALSHRRHLKESGVDVAPLLNETILKRIRDNLIGWYLENLRPLPWRETKEPYHIWVSEVMLQQTQVKTVIGYYQKFIRRFPTLPALAAADLQEVLKIWEGMGYYARARNLHRAAQTLMAEQDGTVPNDHDAFRRLPGVGDYIAAAVQSIAFGQPHAVVDGNVKRVIARLGCVDTPVNLPAAHRVFKPFAQALLDRDRPDIFNQALMELGALVCRPETPLCTQCPLPADCLAHGTNTTQRYPLRVKAKRTPTHPIAVGIVFQGDKVLITRRASEGLLGGLWEFPGGKINSGEDAFAACKREIKEETGLNIEVVETLTTVKHAYTHFKIKMEVFICRFISGTITLKGPVAYRWISLDELDQYPFPKANHKFFPLLRQKRRQDVSDLGDDRPDDIEDAIGLHQNDGKKDN
jgi:A/G-specific adenine glycosylase